MPNPIGPLLPADEQFTHQIVDTFATVGSTDLSWTEKVCAMAAARDGSLQLGFGLGKYTNRDVMDCYAGVSRGVEQLTVRASRRLTPEPELTVVGPIHYEVHDALRTVRFALDANECQPIAFDWTFEAVVPPHVEDRTCATGTACRPSSCGTTRPASVCRPPTWRPRRRWSRHRARPSSSCGARS